MRIKRNISELEGRLIPISEAPDPRPRGIPKWAGYLATIPVGFAQVIPLGQSKCIRAHIYNGVKTGQYKKDAWQIVDKDDSTYIKHMR